MTNHPTCTPNSGASDAATSAPVKPAATPPTKSATFIKLLQRPRGATSAELIAATDWQAHSVRAFLSGLRKKGQTIVREARKNGGFAYRLAAAAKVEPVDPVTTPADAAAA